MITQQPQDFIVALPNGGRLCGLDVGRKTIGLAFCDAGWTLASPATTLARTQFKQDSLKLRDVLVQEQIYGLVIGLPLNMDGGHSPQTQSVRAFAHNLEKLWPDLPMLMWDERWSTLAVERSLIALDVSRATRARKIDQLAACYILQGAIDGLRSHLAHHDAREPPHCGEE